MAKDRKSELGKGIRALISNIEKEPTKIEEAVSEAKSIAEIPIGQIEANPLQPRQEFNQDELLQLVQSIKANGLIQPITVRKLTESSYQIVSGERRFRASKLAGLKSLPCYIRKVDDDAILELALIENIQRSDLNPIEIAVSYQRLIDELRYSQEELALRVGKKRSTVSNFLRILKLTPQIQKALKNKELSMGHAKALLGIENAEVRNVIFHRIIEEGLSVRATEAISKNTKQEKPTSTESSADDKLSIQIRHLEDTLSSKLGTKVQISQNKAGKGQLKINFNNNDMLTDILEYFE